ncbi:276_t:CDS:2 [Paraglomus occultum]|uniref:276_t:CDS:1 n=1 Tax=Paraglomus occultum TaxID=144539 RepID=A0A9N9B5B9_9GLOM|nr:276_t:CDS:2 [Paraglomus occultum]
MAELREKLSQYIGFKTEEIRLPITEEELLVTDHQMKLFFSKIMGIHDGCPSIPNRNAKLIVHPVCMVELNETSESDIICCQMLKRFTAKGDAKKVLIDVPPSKILSRKGLAHI